MNGASTIDCSSASTTAFSWSLPDWNLSCSRCAMGFTFCRAMRDSRELASWLLRKRCSVNPVQHSLCVPSCPLWLDFFRCLPQQLPRLLHIAPTCLQVPNRQPQCQPSIQHCACDNYSACSVDLLHDRAGLIVRTLIAKADNRQRHRSHALELGMPVHQRREIFAPLH